MQQSPRTSPPGVIFDSSLDAGIDHVLALGLLFGLEGRRQVRVPSVTTSRHDLRAASFLDLMARFFGGEQAGDFVINRSSLPVGMSTAGAPAAATPEMLMAVLEKRAEGTLVYPRAIVKPND